MSSRARRVLHADVRPFVWGEPAPIFDPAGFILDVPPDASSPTLPAEHEASPHNPTLVLVGTPAPAAESRLAVEPPHDARVDHAPSDLAEHQAHLAALEREAFTKGYAQGERAGIEAGTTRVEAMLRRLAGTIEELGGVRSAIIRDTERQMVELAITVAQRLVRRALDLDTDLVAALAHAALDRLGDVAPATIRLHPEDYSSITAHRPPDWAGAQVTVVPDAAVTRGGCLVESAFGTVDGRIEAQVAEVTRALLGEDAA